jgi:hypothetical protein
VEWIGKRVIEMLKGRERRESLVVERDGVVESKTKGKSKSKSKGKCKCRNEEKNERVCVWGREKERENQCSYLSRYFTVNNIVLISVTYAPVKMYEQRQEAGEQCAVGHHAVFEFLSGEEKRGVVKEGRREGGREGE